MTTNENPNPNDPAIEIADNTALVVVDVQRGFDDGPFWGPRNNPEAEANIAALMDAWQETGRPVVLVRHTSVLSGSVLAEDHPGHAFKDFVQDRRHSAALLVTKTVNSSFHGTPDLARWLDAQGIGAFVVVGIQTNMCVETTARIGGNLGYDVLVPLDATHTFDLEGPDGLRLTADALTTATAVNLHGGGFARVTTTARLLSAARGAVTA
ncbi:cysteine hydrolase family protein [Streptomyces sp. H27-G5]|uniref:cysteine hydrolase family protein n=1 Tax=Streptomyces sp. H27-G5 TaxID=2996698 RepID=UPI002270B82F|nr:cysteine hydrolase family protein [Streptomyces sp. H27-G5]MCY0918849.1 cysteine hydrolase family protein [Streptomyces sp. H27-G5]